MITSFVSGRWWSRYVVIASGCASCPKLTCERPGCGTLFCYHCKQTWHPNQTCDAARAERLANTRASFSCSQDSSSHSSYPPDHSVADDDFHRVTTTSPQSVTQLDVDTVECSRGKVIAGHIEIIIV